MLTVPKRFTVRHNTLKILSEHYINVYKQTNSNAFSIDKLNIPVKDIADNLDIQEKNLRTFCSLLVVNKEIEYAFDHDKDQEVMRLNVNGLSAYSDKKYITAGQKLRLDTVYDYFKIVSGIALLTVALWTFTSNIIETKENQQQIQELQEQLNQIKKEVTKDSIK